MFKINNLDEFSEKIKFFVFDKFRNSLAEMNNINSEKLEIDQYISSQETKLIISDVIDNNNNGNLYKIPDEVSAKICEAINIRIYSNALLKMVGEGKLDCAFSDEDDCFEFCLTEEGKKVGAKIFPTKFFDDF